MKIKIFFLILFIGSSLILSSCVQKKVLQIIDSDYLGQKILNKKLLISPIPAEIRTGPMIREDSEEYLTQYHLSLINNLYRVIQKESTFESVYYSDLPIYKEKRNYILHLSKSDSFEIKLPKKGLSAQLGGAYKKLDPDFILFFEVEMIDMLTNVSDSYIPNSLNFEFTLAQKIMYVIWDVKSQKSVAYSKKVVSGDINAIGKSIVENTPFAK